MLCRSSNHKVASSSNGPHDNHEPAPLMQKFGGAACRLVGPPKDRLGIDASYERLDADAVATLAGKQDEAPSMSAYSKSGSSESAAKIRSNTPLSAHRRKRFHTEPHLPNASGRSRQGVPARTIHNTASTNSRLSFSGPAPWTRPSSRRRREIIQGVGEAQRPQRAMRTKAASRVKGSRSTPRRSPIGWLSRVIVGARNAPRSREPARAERRGVRRPSRSSRCLERVRSSSVFVNRLSSTDGRQPPAPTRTIGAVGRGRSSSSASRIQAGRGVASTCRGS